MRWIWIRHGETEDNRQRRYLGHYDAPLNSRGREQAEVVAERLKDEVIHYVYTSDLQRCRDTASIIARTHGMTVVDAPALRELDFGLWDRKTYDEIMQTDKQLAEKWYNDPYGVSPPNGESLHEFGNRVGCWLAALEERMQPGETAVLVAHGGTIRWFLAACVAGSPSAFWSVKGPETGDVFVVDKYGQKWYSPPL